MAAGSIRTRKGSRRIRTRKDSRHIRSRRIRRETQLRCQPKRPLAIVMLTRKQIRLLPARLSKVLGFRLLEMSPQTKQGIELKTEQSLPRSGLNNVAD